MSVHERWLRDTARAPVASSMLAPVLRLVRDKVRDVAAVSEAILDNPGRARPRLPASLRARYGQPQQLTVDAEACCLRTIHDLERNMPHLQLPHQFACTCGAVWAFEMALVRGGMP